MKTFKNFFIQTVCFLLLTTFVNAQSVYDDQYNFFFHETTSAEVINNTQDGGHIFAGSIRSQFIISEEQADAAPLYLVKTDDTGYTEWAKSYFHLLEQHQAVSFLPIAIEENTDNSFIIAGAMFYSEITYIPFLLKVNPYGDEEWFHTYDCSKVFDPTTQADMCNRWDIAEIKLSEDGEILVAGSIVREDQKNEILVFRTDADGNPINAVTYGFDNEESAEVGIDIEVFNGEYFILAQSYMYLFDNTGNTLGNEYDYAVLLNLDQQLNLQWSRLFLDIDPSSPTVMKITPKDMIVNSRGEVTIMGLRNREFTNDWNQVFMISLDNNGQTIWDNTLFFYSDTHNSGISNPKLDIDENDQLYLAFDQETLIEYNGEIQMTSVINGAGVIKMNSGGAPQWFKLLDSENRDVRFHDLTIAFTPNGATVGVLGIDETQFDKAWVSRLSTRDGQNECFGEDALIYSKNIEYLALETYLEKIEVYMTPNEVPWYSYDLGYTQERCGEVIREEWAQADDEQFLQTIQQNTTSSQAQLSGNVAPNPSNGQFTLSTELTQNGTAVSVSIFDAMGKMVHQTEMTELNYEFNLSHLPSGTYSIKVQTPNQLEQHKIIIQN